ncbi:MAG: T9SS type A sorting domain-containing protein [Bacteroidales bacterium]|nr:T9SS type A sorting domain-containing protein [Bacteroidales bacterium]
MLKFIVKTMCLALVVVLCSWSLNAQELVSKRASDQAKYEYFAAPTRGIDANCNPVQNLKGLAAGTTVSLSWNAPVPPLDPGWITHSDENFDAIGYTTGGFDGWIAARWTPGDLSELTGYKITKFKYYVYADLAGAAQTLKIWTGGTPTTPGTQVFTYDLKTTDIPGTEQWIEISVPPITIDVTKELWIGAAYDGQPGVYCAPIDGGPANAGFGDLISQNAGVSFSALSKISDIDGNWNLMVFVEDGKGKGFYFDRAKVAGYNVFREGVKIGNTANLNYTDEGLNLGEYRYCVSATYDNGCESEQVCIPKITIAECNPPQKLEIEQTSVTPPVVSLKWEAPIVEPEAWVQRCGNPASGIGGPASMVLGVVFLPEHLTSYSAVNGGKMTSFRFYPRDVQLNYTVRIWKGGTLEAPGTEVWSKNIPKEDIDLGIWNEVKIDVPIIFDMEEPFWIGYTFTGSPNGVFPAGTDNGPMKEGGAMVYQGGKWIPLTQVNPSLSYNWCMSVLIKGSNGKMMELGDRAPVQNYLIYRDGELVRTNTASALTWTDNGSLPTGFAFESGKTYQYCVMARFSDGCQSEMECASIKLEGESVNELANNVSIYPNPAASTVNIMGVDISKVEIYNMVGQMVEVKYGNVTSVDVSAYNTGVYLFKVYDNDNNSVTKRIMVSR